MLTGHGGAETSVEAMQAGAFWYLEKPFEQGNLDAVKRLVEQAIEHGRLKAENRQLQNQLRMRYRFENIVGHSPGLRQVLETVEKIADSDSTILIRGESGTGKELIARAVHFNGPRREKPFISENCAALPDTLLESELFGHERGAFTGAHSRVKGKFEIADGGTLFLDEIGDVTPAIQVKLLRVLQEREIERLGSNLSVGVDVRIIAATNVDLERSVAEGRFRGDLYYRLNVVTADVPPLRNRQDDIPLLAHHFLEKYAKKNRKQVEGFSPIAMDILLKYDWPGNVRELENAVERSVILLNGDYITEKELPLNITQTYSEESNWVAAQPVKAEPRPLEEVEKEAILAALEASGGNKSETARRLGINRKTLHKKLKNYGVG